MEETCGGSLSSNVNKSIDSILIDDLLILHIKESLSILNGFCKEFGV